MLFPYSTMTLPSFSWPPFPSSFVDPDSVLAQFLSNHALFMTDPTGIILSWNPASEALTGYRSEEIIGQSLSIFFPRKDQLNYSLDFDFDFELQLAKDRGRLEFITQRVRKSGDLLNVQYTLTALYKHRKHVGFSVSMFHLYHSRTHLSLGGIGSHWHIA
jgi:PAS domain S-box-containing protein